jgi:hypothetical protein
LPLPLYIIIAITAVYHHCHYRCISSFPLPLYIIIPITAVYHFDGSD